MDVLCNDLLWHIARFLPTSLDVLNCDRVFRIFGSAADLCTVCDLHTLEWYYEAPPHTLRFRATRVVEIGSLEPQYYYKSFACSSYTRRDNGEVAIRKCGGMDVIHIHETWITKQEACLGAGSKHVTP